MDPLDIVSLSQTGKYFTASGLAVLIYDYLLTFSLEVELVWKPKWSIIKALYLCSRYSPFVDLPLTVFRDVAPGISHRLEMCYIMFCITCIFGMFGMGAAELILLWRTYALWGSSRRILLVFLAAFIVLYSAATVVIGIFLHSVQFGPAPLDIITQCWVTKGSKIMFLDVILLMFGETSRFSPRPMQLTASRIDLPASRFGAALVVMVLTLWAGFMKYRHTRNHLLTTLYRDGSVYYVYVFLISAANVVTMVLGPKEYVDVLNEFQRVMHSLISTRIILHVREANVASGDADVASNMIVSSLRIRHAESSSGTSETQD